MNNVAYNLILFSDILVLVVIRKIYCIEKKTLKNYSKHKFQIKKKKKNC